MDLKTIRDSNHGIYRKLPGVSEEGLRGAFKQAIKLRTLAISCVDPRAARVPEILAKEFGETYPGEMVCDEKGSKVGSTTTFACLFNAGGRAVDALRSITSLNYLFNPRNIVVVHHTFCGTTAFSEPTVADAFRRDHHGNIDGMYTPVDFSIESFSHSLQHDVALLRQSAVVPKTTHLFGYLYDIDTESLIKIAESKGSAI